MYATAKFRKRRLSVARHMLLFVIRRYGVQVLVDGTRYIGEWLENKMEGG